tara:strand:+ start:274 stop:447 length:174 start_codon:yes stop_codon:yes gene_type:complete
MKSAMAWVVWEAEKQDAQGRIDILNPIIETGLHTSLDTKQAKVRGRYIDEILIEKFL